MFGETLMEAEILSPKAYAYSVRLRLWTGCDWGLTAQAFARNRRETIAKSAPRMARLDRLGSEWQCVGGCWIGLGERH